MNTSSCKMEHLHTGLQMCATGWTEISQDEGLEEEVHRAATSPDLLDLLTWHQSTIFCGDTSKANCMLRIMNILVTSYPKLSRHSRKCRMEWWFQPWRTSVNDWKWSSGIRCHILKNKVAMCLCVVYIKILMLSEHFKRKLMKIGRIELQLFKFEKWTYKRITLYNVNFSDRKHSYSWLSNTFIVQ